MASQASPLSKLKDYVSKAKETDYDLEATNGGDDYEARINSSLQSLQNQLKEHQAALGKVYSYSPGALRNLDTNFVFSCAQLLQQCL